MHENGVASGTRRDDEIVERDQLCYDDYHSTGGNRRGIAFEADYRNGGQPEWWSSLRAMHGRTRRSSRPVLSSASLEGNEFFFVIL